MTNISYIFESKNRPELKEFIQNFARAIQPSLALKVGLPLVISICGEKNTGKSLFWDEIKNTLLEETAKLDPQSLHSNEETGRIYEKWSGAVNGTDKLSILFYNLSAAKDIDPLNIHPFINQLKKTPSGQEAQILDPRRLGDLLLLSNGLNTPSILDISLHVQTEESLFWQEALDNWKRKIRLGNIKPPLLNSEQFQDFLTNNCEAV